MRWQTLGTLPSSPKGITDASVPQPPCWCFTGGTAFRNRRRLLRKPGSMNPVCEVKRPLFVPQEAMRLIPVAGSGTFRVNLERDVKLGHLTIPAGWELL